MCVCVCSMSIIFLCWCRPLMVNKLVSTRSPHPPFSLPPSSLFKCNWHDSYTSSSLSSQRALKNEPSRCALKWLIFRAILCWIVMFTCVTSRFFFPFFSSLLFNDNYFLSNIKLNAVCVRLVLGSLFHHSIPSINSVLRNIWSDQWSI